MKESKIQNLFRAVRQEKAPDAPFGFHSSVLLAIRRDSTRQKATVSIFEQLSQLFPRLAAASLLVIGLCIATEYYYSQSEITTTADVQQAAEEWLFASN